MLKQFLNSVIAKYRNLSVSCRRLTDIWQRKLFLKKKILKLPSVLQSSKDLSGTEKRLRVGSISYETEKKGGLL